MRDLRMDGQWSGDASHRSTFALAPIGPHIHYGIQPGSNQCSLGFIWTLERFLASCGWGWRSLSHQSLVKIQSIPLWKAYCAECHQPSSC
ncbi:unnamed protein product [Durusdinium trenchii]|uniref:Uncharacterized protein n=1 Tax=Durusdinium trenchii TaxID=1381693 RepID=A0ABP0S219_9DINO